MKIIIRLFATLREGRGKIVEFDFDDQPAVCEVIEQLNVKKEDIAILLINGIDGDYNQLLNDHDVLSLFPPVGGG